MVSARRGATRIPHIVGSRKNVRNFFGQLRIDAGVG
jgi:hypothetical protein